MNSEQDLLQGSWNVAELQIEGQTISGSMLANARVIITGNRFRSIGMGAEYEGVFVLDPSFVPHRIDMKFDAGPEKGNTNPGIYALDGDSWKICLATRSSVRPSSFDAPAGSGFAMETLTRGKPAESAADAGPQPKAGRKVSAEPVTEFEGEWKMISGVMDGQPMDPSAVEWVRRKTHGNETTVTAGPQTIMKMEFTTDAAQNPNAIDYLNTAGPHKGKVQLGIYQFEAQQLTICTSAPGKPRPHEFKSDPGDGRTLTVWKKA